MSANLQRLRSRMTQPAELSYEPTITRRSVVHGADQPLGYNHDSAIEYFQDRWFCFWNASPDAEAVGPQSILMATTPDPETTAWTIIGPAFSDAAQCTNPLAVPSNVLEWQPGLAVIDGVLHALWSREGDGNSANNGTFVSRLSSSTGKWTNEKLSVAPATIGGTLYEQGFVTGDPVELASGRVLCPIIFQSRTVTVALPEGVPANSFYSRAKLAGVIYSDDRGVTWQRGGTVTVAEAEGCVWEPFLSLQEDGSVRMFVRNLYAEQATALMLYSAVSSDAGLTFGPLVATGYETISTRGTVVNRARSDGPSVMVLNDSVKGTAPSSKVDRRALALWLSDDGDTYLPSLAFTDDLLDNVPSYPSARIRNGKLYVSYSTVDRPNGFPSDIRTVVIDPAPTNKRSGRRDNAGALVSPAVVNSPYKAFRTGYVSKLATVAQMTGASATQASVAIFGRFDNTQSCCLVDCRTVANNAGFLVTLNGTISVGLSNGSALTQIDSGVVVPSGVDVYIGVSIDASAGAATVYVVAGGVATEATMPFGFAAAPLNPAQKLYCGCSRVGSTLLSPKSYLRFVRHYSSLLTASQHRFVQNATAVTLGSPAWSGSTATAPTPNVDCDAASSDAGTNNSAWLTAFDATGKKNGTSTKVGNLVTIQGCASVSLLRKGGNTHSLRYSKAAGQTADIVIATVGAPSRFVEIISKLDGSIVAKVNDGGVETLTTLGSVYSGEQIVAVDFTSGVKISHSGCAQFISTGFAARFFAGKAYQISYLSPENSFSFAA